MRCFSRHSILLCSSLVSLATVGSVSGCSTVDPHKEACELTRDAEKSSLALIAKANEPFAQHATEVSALRAKLSGVQSYAAQQLKNAKLDETWRVNLDPQRDLLSGFLWMWEQQGSLHASFIEEKQKEISDAFDQICALECPQPPNIK